MFKKHHNVNLLDHTQTDSFQIFSNNTYFSHNSFRNERNGSHIRTHKIPNTLHMLPHFDMGLKHKMVDTHEQSQTH